MMLRVNHEGLVVNTVAWEQSEHAKGIHGNLLTY